MTPPYPPLSPFSRPTLLRQGEWAFVADHFSLSQRDVDRVWKGEGEDDERQMEVGNGPENR